MAVSGTATTGDSGALDALRDPTGNALRAKAQSDPHAVVKAAAKQFEAMFMQQLMKSMRESSMSTGMLENGGTQMGTDMLDTQLANKISGMPGGLGDALVRQLERQINGIGAKAAAVGPTDAAANATAAAAGVKPNQAKFLLTHQSSAQAASAQTGIPASFMVAQAAHESGWGKHEIKNADGSSSHNLFGIKAGASWKGPTSSVSTTEVVNGVSRKVVAKFRSYASYDEAFKDYAQLMKDNPRYAQVTAAGTSAQGFAQGLQRAGYATDPAYAAKLTKVINTTLRMQRAALNTQGNTA